MAQCEHFRAAWVRLDGCRMVSYSFWLSGRLGLPTGVKIQSLRIITHHYHYAYIIIYMIQSELIWYNLGVGWYQPTNTWVGKHHWTSRRVWVLVIFGMFTGVPVFWTILINSHLTEWHGMTWTSLYNHSMRSSTGTSKLINQISASYIYMSNGQ